eukprot:4771602-Prymnesium_polylepis.1
MGLGFGTRRFAGWGGGCASSELPRRGGRRTCACDAPNDGERRPRLLAAREPSPCADAGRRSLVMK